MDNIWNCPLFNTLIKIKDRCALLTGKKSLLALENYINGYLDACRENDPSSYALIWYQNFSAYLSQICKVDYEKFNISSAISALGYDDKSGVDFFMKTLIRFSETYEGTCSNSSSKIEDSNIVRIFFIDKQRATELIGEVIHGNCEKFFGKTAHEQGRSIVLTWMNDETLLCGLCSGAEAEAALLEKSRETFLVEKQFRIFTIGEKITAIDLKI